VHHRDRGSRIAFAQRVLGCRKSDPEGQLKERLRLSEGERATLGEIGRRLGRKALGEVATAAGPDTILGWYRRLVARKFDGSRSELQFLQGDCTARPPRKTAQELMILCAPPLPGDPSASRCDIRTAVAATVVDVGWGSGAQSRGRWSHFDAACVTSAARIKTILVRGVSEKR
jgi:hypothetical protein